MKPVKNRLEYLEEEVEKIHQRNKRVEGDKAWETSNFRLAVLSIITFTFSLAFLYFIKTEDYLLSALSSTLGLVISSQSLPFIKRWWLKKRQAR